jgi:hypothetical protein
MDEETMSIKNLVSAIFVVAVLHSSSVASDLQVSPNGPEFNSIQDAVNAAVSGDVIHVAPGVYVEQVVIHGKDISILGESGAVLRSPAALAPSDSSRKAVLLVKNAEVSIDGLEVDGNGGGSSNYNFVGIYYLNSGGIVSNCLVRRVRHTPLNGVQGGLAIYARQEMLGPRSLSIINNFVTDFQKNGITTSNVTTAASALRVNVSGNQVQGAGATSVIAQNGIQVYNCLAEIKRNTVSGVEYTGPLWSASGLLIWAAPALVEGNTIVDSQASIYMYEAVGAHLVNNDISRSANNPNYLWGVIFDGGSNNKATNNKISDLDSGIYLYETISAKITANRFIRLRDTTLPAVVIDSSSQIKVRASKEVN